jgi:ribonuclease E
VDAAAVEQETAGEETPIAMSSDDDGAADVSRVEHGTPVAASESINLRSDMADTTVEEAEASADAAPSFDELPHASVQAEGESLATESATEADRASTEAQAEVTPVIAQAMALGEAADETAFGKEPEPDNEGMEAHPEPAISAVEKPAARTEPVNEQVVTSRERASNDPRVAPAPVETVQIETARLVLFSESEQPPVAAPDRNVPRASNDPRGPRTEAEAG